MDNKLIGSQIMKFRKAARITQEELGKAAGVSTQAVSRWECGGTPDVTLLPAIADKLGVTIDALFGREGGEAVDVYQLLRQWIRTVPKEQVFDQMNRLIWSSACQIPLDGRMQEKLSIPYLESGIAQSENGLGSTVNCSKMETDHGVLFGIYANDYAFTTLCPRPEAGYGAYFPEKSVAREFCSLLAQPGCLEVMEYFMHQEGYYYAAEAVSQGTGLDQTTVIGILEEMTKLNLLETIEIGLRQGMEKVYGIQDSAALVPLLYLIRCLTREDGFYYLNYSRREKPLL